jgi:caffeoyl-CoA O-methyltransferase
MLGAMTEPKSFLLSPELHAYLVAHATPPDPVLETLIGETAALGDVARMQIAPEQGPFLTLLARLLDARSIVEVGTFTGYSSICLARGLAPGGRILCCDVSEEWTAVATRAWAEAGLDDRIDLRIAPALETLRALPDEPRIDLAFVDADKGNYLAYYEELVPRLRPGGLLVADNVLWSGAVVDPAADDRDTIAIRAFNDHAAADPRVEPVLLPVGDGLLLARRRP